MQLRTHVQAVSGLEPCNTLDAFLYSRHSDQRAEETGRNGWTLAVFLFLLILSIYFRLNRVVVDTRGVFLAARGNRCLWHTGFAAPTACRTLVPQPGTELASALEGGFLTTGPPEKSLDVF